MSSPDKSTVSATRAKPVRSMTGFAQARRQTSAGEVTVSLRSVNHRGLDLHFHQSHEFAPYENAMRELLKQHIGRGHIEIRAGLTRETGNSSGYNFEALKRYADLFRQASADLGLDSKPDLNVLLGLPGVMGGNGETKAMDASFEADLLQSLSECIGVFNECREREGQKLVEAMRGELLEVERATEEIRGLRDEVLPALQRRLREKIAELLNGSNISEARLAEESAVLADRSDVEEELTRLRVHAQELKRLLDAGGAVGKALDFLLQELNRETNTTLAKSSNVGDAGLKITSLALAVKANIERIREQALNLE
jgi:uncharacterized protein (TIGR00255 family)